MKDAKGHGSDSRGGNTFVGNAKIKPGTVLYGSGENKSLRPQLTIGPAHSTGVDQVGQSKTYQWSKGADGVHRLASGNEPPIASVFKAGTEKTPLSSGPTPKGYYYGQLHKDFNTGTSKSGNWGLLGSVQSAKGWVERKASNSWDAPNISNPSHRGR